VKHPNVVKFYDVVLDSDCTGFTMEYVGGGSIRNLLNGGGAVTPRQAILLLMQVCTGLHAIHNAGLVHRDLKPDNILLTEEGNAKIVDFGVSICAPEMVVPSDCAGRRVIEFQRYMKQLTAGEQASAGTLLYMSPEDLSGESVDRRADIYALGTIGYELLTHRHPFADIGYPRCIVAKCNSDPPPLHRACQGASAELCRIVMKAINRDPEKRFATAAEMLEALWQLDDDLATTPRRRGCSLWQRLRRIS
jgi:serine/threonine-protein kinase